MIRKHWNLSIVLLLLVGLAWIWVSRVPGNVPNTAESLSPAPAVGHRAPDFGLNTLSGDVFVLSKLRGKPVVLNFWATWCPPCRAELPELAAASSRLADEVMIVGVNQAEERADVQAFAAGLSLPFPVLLDEYVAVSRVYRVRSLPTTFFIDRQGIIRQVQVGPVTEATLEQLLKTIYP